MARVSSHKDLIVWQKSVALASKTFSIKARGPQRELLNQMRRSAVSIASNIAEGAVRNSRNDYLRFLNIARSSLSELETQIYIAQEIGMLEPDMRLRETSTEIGRMLTTLIQRLREQRSIDPPSRGL